MKILLKYGNVINVFTAEVENTNVLIEDDTIIGVGSYEDHEADIVEDVTGKYICPGFIDGHIHIESSMLLPAELARVCVPHGTTAIVADPHEIANVSGIAGIYFMLEASENIPLTVYIMLPSCVPSTSFDESGAVLTAKDLSPFYEHPRVLGLAEVMNFPGVIAGDKDVMEKIKDAKKKNLVINGHAPLLTGKALDQYIAAGVSDDHECSTAEEAIERIKKGQWLMIRQGTAARNLDGLLPLFEQPYAHRCVLVTDDKHPTDLMKNGHIDSIIREAVRNGKSVITCIQMATIQTAQCFGLRFVGAIAPGYRADVLVLDELNEVKIKDVYREGKKVVSDGKMIDFENPHIRNDIWKSVRNSFYMDMVKENDFYIAPKSDQCRVIELIQDQLITKEWITNIKWDTNNGIDLERDILKIAVMERHLNSGHIGLGWIHGMGLKKGAIASSVSHDSHNLIVVGTNDSDMATAANCIRELGGGCVVVDNGEILAQMPLPIAGLIGKKSAEEMAEQNENLRNHVYKLGVPKELEPFMSMAFVSLPVIPNIKITTKGLVDVLKQEIVSLYV